MKWINEEPKFEYNGKRVVVREEFKPEFVAYYFGVIVRNIVVYEGAIHGDPEYGAPIHNIVTGITERKELQYGDDTIITDFDGETFMYGECWNASGSSVHPYTYSKRGIVVNYSYALLD